MNVNKEHDALTNNQKRDASKIFFKRDDTLIESEKSSSISSQSSYHPLQNETEIQLQSLGNLLFNKFKTGEDTTQNKKKYCFNKAYLQLKSILKCDESSRKNQLDSLIKKAKARAFKFIHKTLKKCFKPEYKLEKICQSFITNIKIDTNKNVINSTVFDLYKTNEIFYSIEELVEKGFVNIKKLGILRELLHITYREFYEYYISSRTFLTEIRQIRQKQGDAFSILYLFISMNYLNYFDAGVASTARTMDDDCFERECKIYFTVSYGGDTRSMKNLN